MVRVMDGDSRIESVQQNLKIPPNSVEAEQSILGGLMIDKVAWEKISDLIVESDFYRKDHQIIFSVISKLNQNGHPCDVVTVSEDLNKEGNLEDAGGLEYLALLTNETPGAANIVAYSKILRERSTLRALISAGNEISGGAYSTDGRGSEELLDEAQRLVFEISERGSRSESGFKSVKNILPDAMKRIEVLHESEGDITGIPTGFRNFDKYTAGLQNQDLIIIAGRPSMGKTTLAVNIAENAAIGSKIPTAIFSMEMSSEQLMFRMISSLGRVDQTHLRTGNFHDEDWLRINTAVQLMSDAPLYIDDTPAMTPIEVRARARRLKREHGLGLIILDYIQLMHVSGSKENRATEISEISRSLKALAKELKIPIIALSQLNRAVDSRTDKRPILSDLRESGAIEQDADLIVFLFREEEYNPDTPRRGIADIKIAKQRNGPTGEFLLTFIGRYTKFENYSPEPDINESYT